MSTSICPLIGAEGKVGQHDGYLHRGMGGRGMSCTGALAKSVDWDMSGRSDILF